MNLSDLFVPQEFAMMILTDPQGNEIEGPNGEKAYFNIYPLKGAKGDEANRKGLSRLGNDADSWDMKRLKTCKLAAHYIHDGFFPDPKTGENLLPDPFTDQAKIAFLKPLHMDFMIEQIFKFAGEPANFPTTTKS